MPKQGEQTTSGDSVPAEAGPAFLFLFCLNAFHVRSTARACNLLLVTINKCKPTCMPTSNLPVWRLPPQRHNVFYIRHFRLMFVSHKMRHNLETQHSTGHCSFIYVILDELHAVHELVNSKQVSVILNITSHLTC